MNTQSREHNSIRNIMVGIGNQLVILFLNMLSKKIFINQLGHEYLGINGLFTNLFLIFSFAEFGMGAVMIYNLYRPIAKKEEQKIAALYHFFQKIYRIMSLMIALVGLCVLFLLPLIVKTETEMPYLWLFYLLFLGNTVVSNLFVYRTYLVIADQKQSIISWNQLLFDGVGFLVQIAVLLATSNYIYYLLAIWIKTIVSNYVLGGKIKKLYPFLKQKETIPVEERNALILNIKEMFIYKFARAMLVGTDNIIISVMFGTIWVGYYSNYDMVVVGVLSLITMMYSAVSASVGNFFAEKDAESKYKIFTLIQNISIWIVGFTTTCLLLLFQDFLSLWFGKELLLDWKIVVVIVLNYYIHCVRDSAKMFREAAGLFLKVKYMMCGNAVLNLAISILLGKYLGIVGVFLGTAISTLVTVYWFEPFLLYRTQFKKPLFPYFINQVKCFLLMIASIAITYSCMTFLKEVTWGTFILKVGICIIVPNLFYFLVMFKTEAFQYISQAVKSYIHHE